ncbi:hypothetical protein SAY86_013323 [Trapa natans]|uniref:BHLH domain-containing protein n=1 Tax=Trapa natans TaxID=22666 RepID=A0AAN7M137_TRANT|nr:hypothetical protein SAY86_013323 [Trapa natans]
MEEGHRSLFTQLPLSSQSPHFNSKVSAVIESASLGMCAFSRISSQEGMPIYLFPRLPNSRVGGFNKPPGWFYCLPRFRQAFFMHGPCYSLLKEKVPINNVNFNLNAEKKFIVFDQPGDKTTVMVSSRPETIFRCVTSRSLKQPMQLDTDDEACRHKSGPFPCSKMISAVDADGNYEDADVVSEMHEDTEEINALLCSDDEGESYYSEEDDEVTSTGHSPSLMTAHEGRSDHLYFEEDNQEVSSPPCSRKRKWKENDMEALINDTTSSGDIKFQPNDLSNNDDNDAETSSVQRDYSALVKMGLPSSKSKRVRKEKIRETMGLLREMIPDGKGKDAVSILDEAINYLKLLRERAQTLGLVL